MSVRSVQCACETRWMVDFRDDRGKQPVTALVAATAVGIGLPVTLESVNKTTNRLPTIDPDYVYWTRDCEYVSKRCETCGYPMELTECEPGWRTGDIPLATSINPMIEPTPYG